MVTPHFLQIIPSLKGVSSAIDKELRGQNAKLTVTGDELGSRRAGQRSGKAFSEGAERETRGLGRKIGDAFDPSIAMGRVGRAAGTALKGAMLGGVAGVGAVIAGTVGAGIFKGFDRLKSIDDARSKLLALHNSVADVQTIMDSALASVKGTAFGLGDAATIAANAVAAGVKPGADLTKYLTLTADAAAIAGTNLGDMGQIINQVHTGQKAYTDDLNQLADRGIPIYQYLSDQLHISAADVKQFAADGKISAADFETAIATHIGGAAQTMGTSFSGALQNAEAALGRLGAAFLQPAFSNAAGGLGSVTSGLDNLTAWIGAHQGTIIDFWKGLGDFAITGAENFAHGVGGALQALGDLAGGIGNVKGFLDDLMGDMASLKGDDAGAEVFHKSAQEAYGWGEAIRAAGDKLVNLNLDSTRDKLHGWADAARDADAASRNAQGGLAGLGQALGAVPPAKNIDVHLNTAEAEKKWNDFKAMLQNPPTPTVNVRPGSDALAPGFFTPPTPGRAGGGPISGPGGPKSDIIPIWASNGEYVVNAAAASKHRGLLEAINSGMPRFADGGAITIDSLKQFASGIAGHGYHWGGGNGDTFDTDCSGAQSTVANYLTGGKGRFATGSEAGALASRGFRTGDPPPGVAAYWVGWVNGGPGGGHTAGTIIDPKGGNVNVEMGGSSGGGAYGGKASGASGFPNRAWFPITAGDDPSKNNFAGGASPFAGGSASAAATGGGGDLGGFTKSTGGASSSSGGGGSLNLPSSLDGFGAFAGEQLGKLGGIGDLGKLGSAAGSFVDGQVASALDVFGIPSNPGWLQGISKLVGGISIGGGGGAAPLSLGGNGGGTPPPGDPGNMHGTRAGQAPGVTYNIQARDTEDAFVKAQRVEREKSAAKLSRF